MAFRPLARLSKNCGWTSLKRKRIREDPMRAFDRLPPALRVWLAHAALPWQPRSAHRAFKRALARTGDTARALQELDRLERQLVAQDAPRVWGRGHPAATPAPPARRGAPQPLR